MAARLRPRHQDDIKKKIQASQLVNFLQDHALKGGEVNTSRIDAAKFLLNKTLSNAPTDTTIANPDGSPLLKGITVVFQSGSEVSPKT